MVKTQWIHAFKPVKIDFGQIHIKGGFLAKAYPATVKVIEDADRKQWQFVKMSSAEYWLVAARRACKRRDRRGYGRTSLLCTLREHVVRFCNGIDHPETVPQDGDTDTHEVDPMNELVLATQPAAPNTVGLAADKLVRTRRPNMAKHSIVTVNIPRDPPEVDPNCTQMRPVKLFINDRKTVWLHVEDLAWAVKF